MSSPGVTPDVDMKDVELNEVDVEKQLMNASPPLAGSPGSLGEKNGVVKVKVPDEEEEGELVPKFTGLSKEELLQVAGTPGWVRTRWALLVLFWLGWLGMLAGAIVIIVQAPRCRDLPKQEWWQKGGLYRIQALANFQDSDADGVGDLMGLKQRIDYLNSLKVAGMVVGPLHVNPKDDQTLTDLKAIDPKFGTMEHFHEVLQAAKKKNLKVVLDLTPNYLGQFPWFSGAVLSSSEFQDKMKEAIEFWLKEGVSGIQIGSVEQILNDTQLLDDWKNLTSQYSVDDHARVLIAATSQWDAQGIFSLLNESKADLLTSQYLEKLVQDGHGDRQGEVAADMITNYIRASGDKWSSWSVARPLGQITEQLLRLYHMLLYTLRGTPFTDYGDEIGLWDLPGQPAESSVLRMQWDDTANFGFSSKAVPLLSDGAASNVTVQLQSTDMGSMLALFQQLSELRGKERSLLHGDFSQVHTNASPNIFAYQRVWDQNRRFIVVLNFAPRGCTVSLADPDLPSEATVELSTHPQREKQQLGLQRLELGSLEGLVLSFPYVA